MKADIHPTYYPNAVFTCACGATYTIGSTKESVQVEICSNCHPFYTGAEKVLDSAGRVDKFNTRKAASAKKAEGSAKTAKKK
jgi:large subunit ribosomal protein L31